jgi:hypothetical protein
MRIVSASGVYKVLDDKNKCIRPLLGRWANWLTNLLLSQHPQIDWTEASSTRSNVSAQQVHQCI